MSVKRTFTWQELRELNLKHNAHVAIRGKVSSKFHIQYLTSLSFFKSLKLLSLMKLSIWTS